MSGASLNNMWRKPVLWRIFYFSAEARRSISPVFEDEELLPFWFGKVLLSYIPVLTLILKFTTTLL